MNRVPLYDALAPDYDRFVNWEQRLAHELPFLVDLLEQHGVHSVLDAACGTGHHALALANSGYSVVGADLSSAMIDHARQNAASAGLDVPFLVLGLEELGALGHAARFDAVLCLGSSLPHLTTPAAMEAALAGFAALLRPGGLLVVQNRNFDRVWAARERFMSPQSASGDGGDWLFVRFYDFHEETITFNMIRLHRQADGWEQTVESTALRPIFREELGAGLLLAGFDRLTFFGGSDGSSYDPAHSTDLIGVALRAG